MCSRAVVDSTHFDFKQHLAPDAFILAIHDVEEKLGKPAATRPRTHPADADLAKPTSLSVSA